MAKKKKKKKSSKWIDTSAFRDGYDFGDVTKTIVSSAKKSSKQAGKAVNSIADDTMEFLTRNATKKIVSGTASIGVLGELFESKIGDPLKEAGSNFTSAIKKIGDDEDGYFSKGLFKDGYDFGDVTKTLIGSGADMKEDFARGIGKIGEGFIDTGATGLAGLAKRTGNNNLYDKTIKFIERDLDNELRLGEKVTGKLFSAIPGADVANQMFDTVNAGVNKGKHELSSLLGTKADSLVQAGGQLAGTAGLQAAGVPWWLTTGVTGFGSGAEEAFLNDATYGEAVGYGAISGASEVIFEKLSGGIKFGGKTLDEGLKRKLSDAIANKTASSLAKFGLDVAGEGTEEVLTEITQNIGKKLTYEDEKTWGELLTSEEAMDGYIESFIGGAVLGGGMSGAGRVRANKTGRDYDTGLTDNEQSVVTAEVESRAAEQQKKSAVDSEVNRIIEERQKTIGELTATEKKNVRESVQSKLDSGELDFTTAKLSARERAKIEQQVREDLENGYIGIDSIESTLAKDKTIRIKDLEQQLTAADPDKKAQIEAEINDLKLSRARQMKGMLSKDNYLQESYKQEALKSQEFSRETTDKDSDITKELIESAKNSKMNNTRKMHDLFEYTNKIANDSKTKYGFVNNEQLKELGYEVEGVSINGLVRVDKEGSTKVLINTDSDKAINTIIGHETTHLLEDANEYKALQNIVKEYATTKGDYDSRVKQFTKLYDGTNANIENEVTADLVGDYLFTDEQFIQNLSVKEPNVFQKVYDYIKHVYKMATAGSKEARQLEQVKRRFDKAYKEISKTTTQEIKDNSLTEADSNTAKFAITEKMSDAERAQELKDKTILLKDSQIDKELSEVISDGPKMNTVYKYIRDNRERLGLNKEFAANDVEVGFYYFNKGINKSLNMMSKNGSDLKEYGHIVSSLDDILDNAVLVERHSDKGGLNKDLEQVYVLLSGYKDGSEVYPVEIEIREYSNRENGLYVAITIEKNEVAETGNAYKEAGADSTSFEISIPQLVGLINPKASHMLKYLPDGMLSKEQMAGKEKGLAEDRRKYGNRNRNLTKEQEEYFKDSKVRDENGNLKVMYHGTSAGGHTVFDPYGKAKYGLFGVGSYFTDNKSVAESYTEKGKGNNKQIYETYLNITSPIDMDAAADPTAWSKALPDVNFPAEGTNEDFYRTMEEYFEDQEYSRWEASEAALEVMESMGYDGITHVGGGRFNKQDETRHRVYIAFHSEQIKRTDNTNPTKDPDIRYSLSTSDGEYMTAVETGDTGTAQRLVDEAARAAGYNVKAFHGTPAKFTRFNTDLIYFTVNKKHAAEYGENVQELYIKAEKPYITNDETIRNDNGDPFLDRYGETVTVGWLDSAPEALEYLLSKGYDAAWDQGMEFAVSFSPENIKSADYITYDDEGDIIPPSKRFDEQESDIRYSLSDNRGRTLSKQQQERFKDSKVRNENGELLVMYHGTPSGDFTVFKDGTYFTQNKEYADRYQDPSASSISTGKVKNNPKTFEVYLDIKKPFDISDPEAREIYINDYIKGGNAMGINPYLSDAEYSKIDTIDWTEGEDLRDFLIEEGYDYDGLVLDEGADGGYGDAVEYRGKSYVVFSPEQVKNVDNMNPTDDPDIRYSLSENDIAPIRDDYKALTERDIPYVEQQGTEAFNSITDDMAPVEMDEPIYDEDEPAADPVNPLEADGRDIKDVGKRNIKAYMYENPEVKPFFQAEAAYMLNDLKNSVKGQKHFNDQLYYDSAGEQGFWGTKRQTSEEIAYLLDEFNYSYADIEKGLNAIIEDHGAENNAISKRIEFMIDERLREGYEDMMYGDTVPPNEEYLNLLREKQITEYSDEAYEAWVRSLADVEAPVEPITQGGIDYIRSLSREAGIDTSDITGRYGVGSLEEMSRDQYMDAVKWLDQAAIAPVRIPEAPTEDIAPIREDITPVREATRTMPDDIAPIRDDIPISQGVQQEVREDGTIGDVPEDITARTRRDLQRELLSGESNYIIKALEKAKNIPMALMNNTDTIRNNEMVFGRAAGKKINEAIFQKAIDNEARSIYWQNKQRADIKALGIKARSKESAAVQKYGEGEYINEFGDLMQYGDGDLMMEFPDVATQEKIKEAARIIKAKYERYIDQANEVLTGLGFDPIPKRKDYMRHFQELNDVFSKNGIPFNPQNMKEHVLPTDINGLTEFWSPQKNYFANIQPRKGKRTTLDAITGIDGYISGISNLIFHTEDIQRGRAFEGMIRENFGEERGWDIVETLPPEEQGPRAELIQDNHLSNYAAWVHEWTNNIAGKKNKIDRSVEATFGRKGFTVLDTIRKQVGANMIGFNIASSLTNLIAPIQAMSKTNKTAVMKGAVDTFRNIVSKDGFVDKNPFLTSRFGTDMLSKTKWEKITDAGYIFMKGMDHFSSNLIVRSKYNELIKKGMSEKEAHKEAGKFAARIMGDRTKGANAQLYNSKMVGVLTQFQLEVNNQLYSMFYDTYHDSKENAKGNAAKMAAGMTFTLGQLFAFTHLFGKGFEAVAGYNPTFDVIGIVATLLGIGGDEEEEKTFGERSEAALQQLIKSLPYSSILTGGRIPIGQALPIKQLYEGEDDYGNEKSRWKTLAETIPYYAMPAGYGQIKKTAGGVEMFIGDKPVAGSYTDSGNLRFPVEETPMNVVHAAIFGKWANKNAQDYIDNERMPLKEKQIQEYKDLEMPIKDYWEYREGLKGLDTNEEKFDYIADLNIPVRKKNIMINNIVNSEDRVDLTDYSDYGSYEEFKVATKNPEKYSMSKVVGFDDYQIYAADIDDIHADKDSNGNYIRGTRQEKVIDYINGLDIDYEAKLILYKKEYNSDDAHNQEIIDYLNSRDDISYQDMESILLELGFEVASDGTIYW